MRHFCTYCDINYLPRVLVVYNSLIHVATNDVTLWVLCLDETTMEALQQMCIPGIEAVSLATIEAADPDLLTVKSERKRIEYYFTLSPIWPLYLLNTVTEMDIVTYIDSDLRFYHDPEPIFAELGNQSILIIPHRFPEENSTKLKYGIYNVGLLCFRNDEHGRSALSWWRERCLEWCKDELDESNERYADQKYLDKFPTLFARVVVSGHVGANLAPWNFYGFRIWKRNDDQLMVGEVPIIFFHFQGLRLYNDWLYFHNSSSFSTMPETLFNWLYPTYFSELVHMRRWLRRYHPDVPVSNQHTREGVFSLPQTLQQLKRGNMKFNWINPLSGLPHDWFTHAAH